MKRYRATALVLPAMLLALFATPGRAQVKNPDTFTYLTIGDPDSLDPAWSYDTASHEIIDNVYEYLLQFKADSLKELEPLLATRVPSRANGGISADSLTYTFPIRKGVKFHDGSELTPEDVRYSLLRFILYDRDGGPSSILLDPILGVNSTRDAGGKPLPDIFRRADKAISVKGGTVVIRLAKPYAPFLSILTNFGAILSKNWCAKNGQWDGTQASWLKYNNPKKEDSYLLDHMNGTGPFSFDRWDKRTAEVVLDRNDHYWRKPARLKKVVVQRIEEFATRKLMLQAGDADDIYSPQLMFSQLERLPGVQLIDKLKVLETPTLLLFTFKINPVANPNIGSGKLDGNGIPPDFFSDKNVRKAFAYSIDYDAYARDVLRGKGRPAGSIIPEGMLGYDPGAKPYKLDLAKAAEYFKKAWGGQVWDKGFQFTFIFNDNQPNILTLAEMMKRNVESLNPKFRIDVRTVQWSTYLDQTQGRKIPLFVAAWEADYPDPHNMIFPLLHSEGYYPSKQGYNNPKIDRLIDEAVTSLDPSKRDTLYRRVQEIAHDELPLILVAEGYRFRAQRSWVKGWVFRRVFPDSPYGSYYYDLYKEEK